MTAATPVRFSLGSLNLHCGRDQRGRPFSVLAALRGIAADVILLQENWRPDGAVSIVSEAATELGYDKTIELDVFAHTSLRNLGIVDGAAAEETGAWGLAILTRIPMAVAECTSLGWAPGDRGARLAQAVMVGDGALRLVNVHLTHRLSYGPGQLRRLTAANPAYAGPTVLAGDFNMFRPMIRLARGYRCAVRGRTWPGARPAFQIDHILVNRGIRVSGAQVGDPIGSDHLPVRATLTVDPQ